MWNFGSKNSSNKTQKRTEKQVVGKIGEDCACEYLKKKGYKIIDRNYLKKWGEIDIVARNSKMLHFVEVKSVSREINVGKSQNVTRGTSTVLDVEKSDSYRPEDNMHPWKLQRLSRVIQSYLLDKDVPDDADWQFDVITVYVDREKKIGRVFVLEDVVL